MRIRDERLQREEQILVLRDAGRSFRQIAAQLNLSPGHVHRVYKHAIAQPPEHVEEFRSRQMRRLERVITPLFTQLAMKNEAYTGDDFRALHELARLIDIENRLQSAYPAAEVQIAGGLTVEHVSVESVMEKLYAWKRQEDAASEAQRVLEQVNADRAALMSGNGHVDAVVIE